MTASDASPTEAERETVQGDLLIGSYNLWKNNASHELERLVEDHRLDVLCLQEADSAKLPPAIGPLHRSAATERNRLGLAIYHRADEFEMIDSSIFTLPKSFHDHLMSPGEDRLLAVRLRDPRDGNELVVASFHAAPLTTVNSARRRQIKLAHGFLAEWAPELPMVMVGDYNYPWFRQGLAKRIVRSGHEITFSDSHTYRRYRYIRGHFDFVTSLKVRIESVASLPKGASDHMPILVRASVAV
ncbi:MAG: endonuclease/exonuclease/phosphatase family protein [Micrococcales bacterium]|nr:endonuclease/exonuclease/phosphatase family protein [Micrococcales bacterium]